MKENPKVVSKIPDWLCEKVESIPPPVIFTLRQQKDGTRIAAIRVPGQEVIIYTIDTDGNVLPNSTTESIS